LISVRSIVNAAGQKAKLELLRNQQPMVREVNF